MLVIRKQIAQTVAGSNAQLEIDTNLGGSLSAMKLQAIQYEFLLPNFGATGYVEQVTLSTTSAVGHITDPDVIARATNIYYGDNLGEVLLLEPRLTVQGSLFLTIASNRPVVQTVYVNIFYDLEVLKEIEFLRLQAAGS